VKFGGGDASRKHLSIMVLRDMLRSLPEQECRKHPGFLCICKGVKCLVFFFFGKRGWVYLLTLDVYRHPVHFCLQFANTHFVSLGLFLGTKEISRIPEYQEACKAGPQSKDSCVPSSEK
jgi:hypothetical protein